jgi:hypothetical protein
MGARYGHKLTAVKLGAGEGYAAILNRGGQPCP